MLPLHLPALPPGTLHSVLQLAGPGDSLPLWPFVTVTLCCLIQRLVFHIFALCSPPSWAQGLQKLFCLACGNQGARGVWMLLLQGKGQVLMVTIN